MLSASSSTFNLGRIVRLRSPLLSSCCKSNHEEQLDWQLGAKKCH